MPAVVLYTVLFKILYCKIKTVFFIYCVCFFIYYLCGKYYKPIMLYQQYYIANCVRWMPRLTVGYTNKLDLQTMLSEWNSFICGGLTVHGRRSSLIKASGRLKSSPASLVTGVVNHTILGTEEVLLKYFLNE